MVYGFGTERFQMQNRRWKAAGRLGTTSSPHHCYERFAIMAVCQDEVPANSLQTRLNNTF